MVDTDTLMRLRHYIAEPNSVKYSDNELTKRIESAAIMDKKGNEPDEPNWTPTYDLYLVASEIWLEKAGMVADEFDFSSDGGNFSRSQKSAAYLRQAGYYKSRSKANTTMLVQRPLEKLSSHGWEDSEYKDDIDEYEANLK